MKSIWKFRGDREHDVIELSMPKDAKVLSVGLQHDRLTFWAEVFTGTEIEYEIRKFFVVGTGHPLPVNYGFVGTVFQGPFVWHIFDGGLRG